MVTDMAMTAEQYSINYGYRHGHDCWTVLH